MCSDDVQLALYFPYLCLSLLGCLCERGLCVDLGIVGLVGGLVGFRFAGLGCCVYLVLRGICFVLLCCFELCLLLCCWWFYVMFGFRALLSCS